MTTVETLTTVRESGWRQRFVGLGIGAALFAGLLGGTVAAPSPGAAHALNDGYSMITVTESGIEYDLYLPEVGMLAFDADGDKQVTPAELQERQAELTAYVDDRLTVTAGDDRLVPTLKGTDVGTRSDVRQVELNLWYPAESEVDRLRVEYGLLLDDGDPDHISYIYLFDGDTSGQSLFDQANRTFEYERGAAPSLWEAVWEFGVLGVEHIVMGWDHLLFLLALLIAARGLGDMVRIITAFTAAHTITLLMTASGWIDAPGWVEAAIALSIAYVAADNLWLQTTRWRIAITFAFGLIHGMGFAGALIDIGIPARHTIVSLVSFNVGVELGQIALALVALPLLLRLRRKRYYGKIVAAVSIAVMAMALYWLAERIGLL